MKRRLPLILASIAVGVVVVCLLLYSVVLSKEYDCSKCHSKLGSGYDPATHHIDRLAQPRVCTTCHSGEDR